MTATIRSFPLSVFAATAVSALTAFPALAADVFEDTQVSEAGKLSFSISAAYFDMDVVNGLGTSINDAGFLFIRQAENGSDIEDFGLKGSADFWRQAQLPHLGTAYVFGGVDGAWVEGDDNARGTLNAGEFLDTLPINGNVSPGAILAGAGAEFFISSDTEFWRAGAYAGVGNDLAGGDGKIGYGLYGAISQLDFDSSVQDQAGNSFIRLNYDVDTYSIGPMVTGERRFMLANGMNAWIGGKLAVLYADGDMDGVQTASNLGTPISVSDDSSDLAFLGQLNAGIDLFSNGQTTISLIGGVEWRNDVYEVVNPRSGPGLVASNAASYAPGPARLKQTDQFSASVGLKATVRF